MQISNKRTISSYDKPQCDSTGKIMIIRNFLNASCAEFEMEKLLGLIKILMKKLLPVILYLFL